MTHIMSFLKGFKIMRRKISALCTIVILGVSIPVYLFKDSISQNSDQISTFLAHPLVLLLIGTVISSILIPTFTQKTQDRKKKIEIKIEIGREISQAVTQAIAISIAITSKKNTVDDQAKCVTQLKKIETDLWTYFPQTNLANQWLEYSDLLQILWPLTDNLWNNYFGIQYNKEYIDRMEEYHSRVKSQRKIDWNKLHTSEYLNEYYNLRTFVFEEFKIFVIQVHMSKITIF